MSRWITLAAFALLTAGTTSVARAQALGPEGKPNYVIVHGELMRSAGGLDGPLGGSVEWGTFQNKYIGAGTKLGIKTAGNVSGMPRELFFGGGPQGHIPIGRRLLIVPAVNLGYRLTDGASGLGGGIAVYGSLGVAFRHKSFYIGAEAERPIYLPLPGTDSAFFPNITSAGMFVGAYF